MNIKAMLVASVLGALVMWITGGVFHEIIFSRFFARETGVNEHQGVAIIFVACLILALMMTYLIVNLAKGEVKIADGIKYGVFAGVLWVFPHGLAIAAAHGESLSYEVLNGLYHVFEQGLGGVVIAMVYQRMTREKI